MKYIAERFNKLVAFDKIRLLKIVEMSQYAFFYVIIAFILGYFTDKIFPKRDEETKTVTLIVETIIQSMVAVITVFYIRKIVKLIPFALKNVSKNYISYNHYTKCIHPLIFEIWMKKENHLIFATLLNFYPKIQL